MKYKINSRNFYELLFKIKNLINENENTIKELLSIDNKYCKMIIDIKELKNILSSYNNVEINDKVEKMVIKIIYNGNPYMTLNLSILAIISNSTIILESDQKMSAINTFLVKIINNALRDFDRNDLIFFSKDIEKEDVDKIICIDDIHKYNEYMRMENKKVRFYSMNYIDFYSDSDEFNNLQELIYEYAELNSIPIESYSELDHEEAINMLQMGLGKVVLVLTNNESLKKEIKNNVKNKEIYINQNPFMQKMKLIDKEILYI